MKRDGLLFPGLLSLLLHAALFSSLILWIRPRATQGPAIELDLGQQPTVLATTARDLSSRDEWRQHQVRRKPQARPTPEPTPLAAVVGEPTPVASPSPSGNGPFLGLAQVNRPPRPLNPIKPLYPDAARRANIEGVVILQVDIDATGAVKKVGVVQGLGYGCDEEAIAAVRQTAWEPALDKNDQPVATKLRIPFRFKFE